MKYKLICTDMDGTLLNPSHEVSERNKAAINKAHELGVKIAIATGRMYNSAAYYADLIGVKAPVISANGAFVRGKDKEDVIYKKVLGMDNCMKILTILNKYNIIPHYHTPEAVFSGDLVYSAKIYNEKNSSVPEDLRIDVNIIKDPNQWEQVFRDHDKDILKCIGVDEDVEKISKAKEELREIEGIEVVSSYITNIEINAKGVTKGRAVEVLASLYNIDKEEIICIGDNENDLSMIEYAGLGVAMGNAEAYVKERADYVTATNDDDGVAEVIEKFVIEEYLENR